MAKCSGQGRSWFARAGKWASCGGRATKGNNVKNRGSSLPISTQRLTTNHPRGAPLLFNDKFYISSIRRTHTLIRDTVVSTLTTVHDTVVSW